MIKVNLDDTGYIGHILLEPNISLSWKTNIRIFLFITLITSIIGGYFFMIGGWLVLPFSGLELLMIGISLYMFFHHYNHCEVIRFTDNEVVIEYGKDAPEKSWEYQRHWSSFQVQDNGICSVPALRIKSHGKELELGAFLGYDEKEASDRNSGRNNGEIHTGIKESQPVMKDHAYHSAFYDVELSYNAE